MYKVGDIVKGKVSGIENYGIFITLEDNFNGLIHISEIEHGYIKNIKDYVKLDENIYVYILEINEKAKSLKLSIKNINYKFDNKSTKIKESIKGFLPLYDKLQVWIEDKLKEIEQMDNF